MIARLSTIRQTVQEILRLSVKSASLADSKTKLFCQQYGALTRYTEGCNAFLSILSKDFGLKSKNLYQTVSRSIFFLLLDGYQLTNFI